MNIQFFIVRIITIILILSCLVILYKWKNLNKPTKIFGLFLIWNLTTEIVVTLYTQHYKTNNLPFLHLYTLGEFILLSFFYQSLFKKELSVKSIKYLNIYILLGITLIILNSIFLQEITIFNSYAKTFVQVSIIAYSVLYFYNLSSKMDLSSTNEKSLRLINSALMVYYSGSLFIFMFGNYAQSNHQDYAMFWVFNAGLNLIFQLAVLYAIWKIAFKETKLSI